MQALSKHAARIAVTLLPLIFALLHAAGALPMGVLQRLDDIIFDARLRATMPQTLDERVVIIDIDEQSLAEVGRWPWSRNHLARLVDTLFDDHGIALLGFDTVFAEPDDSSGLRQLEALAQGRLADVPGLAEHIEQLRPELDHDALFARSLQNRPVVLGYYFTSDRDGRKSGVLPEPVMEPGALQGRTIRATSWNGHGANLGSLMAVAPQAGFFNAITASDGVVRSVPLLAEFEGRYYESLSLAMFRRLVGLPTVEPGFPAGGLLQRRYQALESVRLTQGGTELAIPVDDRVLALVPFRGPGGPQGGSFRYHSAADVLAKRIPGGALKGKIALLGTTAPGLLDLRVTPVGQTYPGVETHANLIASLLDGEILVRPDYALGYEVLVLIAAGLVLALWLPLLSATRAVALSLGVVGAIVALNFWLYVGHALVLPLATSLVMAALAFALNMSYGYLVESRAKRELAHLFGTYVPPELVDEMVKDPDRYTMAADARELTVMFCDMRGFTRLAETMAPTELQALLNAVFSRLTHVIRQHRGTIDKYMGDCVMAFWGAPVHTPDHAALAVQAALDMAAEVDAINREHARQGLPAIGVGIGLNTGDMCVGDMGSDVRRSYTVIGDAVNLASRLEGLAARYGATIVASDTTRAQCPGVLWQELDRVRVKGKAHAVTIHTPLCRAGDASPDLLKEMALWKQALSAWRAQAWDDCDVLLLNLSRQNAEKVLYQRMTERVAFMRRSPPESSWDGATTFDTK
ncbi:CHASE2 domain-containing protein [Hydrogenophaga sp.]|uniref:CHASE2 domain-containing protein n=1 Tax=Hydrogenophaga sp. TaxID=1904254 RepID=UPI0027266E9B|nr:adenylate/guanylate cyclase domain-containing protein [Hydrogenophaga sp.]MDO8903191.1 adenylate/guanylate cyclase domain-containing protein [Hydrogenophaga sp.]